MRFCFFLFWSFVFWFGFQGIIATMLSLRLFPESSPDTLAYLLASSCCFFGLGVQLYPYSFRLFDCILDPCAASEVQKLTMSTNTESVATWGWCHIYIYMFIIINVIILIVIIIIIIIIMIIICYYNYYCVLLRLLTQASQRQLRDYGLAQQTLQQHAGLFLMLWSAIGKLKSLN